MNGSEIEQSIATADSTLTADCTAVLDKEEPPGSPYPSSLSYDALPLFSPPAKRHTHAAVAEPGLEAGVNRRLTTTNAPG
jgi:hypothetical protein